MRDTISESDIDPSLIDAVSAAFSANGLLSQQIKGYQPRDIQCQMALEVANALVQKHNLVLEAGTGVGKTFAYLIPALLSGQSIAISTGSKNLQEQLFYQDLPLLLNILELHPKLSLLKGRNNYLCQHRLQQQLEQIDSREADVLDDMLRINQWAALSKDGDLDALTGVAESSSAIDLIRSTKESCINQHCKFYTDCFTRKARSRALQADLIVLNHHLFFADKLLKDTGFAELLPCTPVVIFDEAHQLPDMAVNYFGQQCSTRQLSSLLTKIHHIYQHNMKDTGQLGQLSLRCLQALNDWHNVLFDTKVFDWRILLGDKQISGLSWDLIRELEALQKLMLAHVGRNQELDDYTIKFAEIKQQLELFFQCENIASAYSIEFNQQYVVLRISPVNIAKDCADLFDKQSRWIFTSATLQVNYSLQHFVAQMGITAAKQVILDSPFDYQRQALFCVPRYLAPVTNQTQAAKQLIDICTRLVQAADGRTFILFTSHRMLELVASGLASKLLQPVLVQGQGGKQHLLKKFRQLGNAVLLGTGSFWEGVDVKGNLLRCVVIDKLPFVSPDAPLYKARAEAILHQGGDPFAELSLPQAVITLKQGVGRLIRNEQDKGVLVLCDSRIVHQAYGKAFIASLPPMQRTRDLDKALEFLAKI